MFKKVYTLIILSVLFFGGCKKDDPTPIITITTHPSNVALTQGSITGVLGIEATVTEGATLNYQWHRNTANSNVGGTSLGAAASSATFALPSDLTAAESPYYYYCVVSASGGATPVSSNAATVTVIPLVSAQAPVITAHPANATYLEGATAPPLSVAATSPDGGTLSYQWYSNTTNGTNGGTAAGTNSSSYTPPTTDTGTLYYYVVVTNTNNSVNGTKTATQTSNVAAVTVTPLVNAQAPVITTHPANASYLEDATATSLSVTATSPDGGTLSYQWYSNTTNGTSGGTAVGANSSSYSPPTTPTGTLYYYVVITNTNNSVNGTRTATQTSNVAAVSVNIAASQFSVDGIYYKHIRGGNVKVTNQGYDDAGVGSSMNSYSGAVSVPATVMYNGDTYTVQEIGRYSFAQSRGLTSVTLPEGIIIIDYRAFEGCYFLNTLHIPASVTTLDDQAFNSCSELSLTAAPGGKFSVTDDVLFEGNGSNAQYYLRWIPFRKTGSYTIPNGVVNMATYAVCLIQLTAITIPASVTTIQQGCFYGGNVALTTITLPWADPQSCTIDNWNQFWGVDKAQITLHVPSAAAIPLYRAHAIWGSGFKDIVSP